MVCRGFFVRGARWSTSSILAGAAVVVDQRHTSGAALAALVKDLMGDPDRRGRMSAAMAALGRPRAAAEITDRLATLL